jgi:hypothetical protein
MKKLVSAVLVVVLLVCLAGCDTYAMFNYYFWNKSDCWYCEEIDFEMYFTYDQNGILIDQGYELIWNEEVYVVHVGTQSAWFFIDTDKNGNNLIEMDEILLEGEWYYRDDNLVFEIRKDNLFDGAYKELVFVPVE